MPPSMPTRVPRKQHFLPRHARPGCRSTTDSRARSPLRTRRCPRPGQSAAASPSISASALSSGSGRRCPILAAPIGPTRSGAELDAFFVEAHRLHARPATADRRWQGPSFRDVEGQSSHGRPFIAIGSHPASPELLRSFPTYEYEAVSSVPVSRVSITPPKAPMQCFTSRADDCRSLPRFFASWRRHRSPQGLWLRQLMLPSSTPLCVQSSDRCSKVVWAWRPLASRTRIRHGLIWLSRGALVVEDEHLPIHAKASEPTVRDPLGEGDYAIPFQMVSMILLGPGSIGEPRRSQIVRAATARQLPRVGEDRVRAYTAPLLSRTAPVLHDDRPGSRLDADGARLDIARRMYAWRLGRDPAAYRHRDPSRHRRCSCQGDVQSAGAEIWHRWNGRAVMIALIRMLPTLRNQALNHAASAVEAAAGDRHGRHGYNSAAWLHSRGPRVSRSCLDIADVFRDDTTVPVAFEAVVERGKVPRHAPSSASLAKRVGVTLRKSHDNRAS